MIHSPEPYGHLWVTHSFRVNSDDSVRCSPGSLHAGYSFCPAMATLMFPGITPPSSYFKLSMLTSSTNQLFLQHHRDTASHFSLLQGLSLLLRTWSSAIRSMSVFMLCGGLFLAYHTSKIQSTVHQELNISQTSCLLPLMSQDCQVPLADPVGAQIPSTWPNSFSRLPDDVSQLRVP